MVERLAAMMVETKEVVVGGVQVYQAETEKAFVLETPAVAVSEEAEEPQAVA